MWLGDVVRLNTLKKEISIIDALCDFSSSLYLGKTCILEIIFYV